MITSRKHKDIYDAVKALALTGSCGKKAAGFVCAVV
jgi:hypothetical protein